MSNILITGIGGFTGSHLCEHLLNLDEDLNIYGTIRGRCRQTDFIDHIKDKLRLLECDLTDYNAVKATIDESQPDFIFHLAAQTFVPTSWRAPQETLNTNIIGTLNLLESIRHSPFTPRIQITGTSEEYGLVEKENLPIKETCPLNPLSPYAVSKCLTGETKIFTENGLKRIKDIKIGDRVWTHNNKLQKVTNVFKRKHIGDMVTIRLASTRNNFLNNCQLTLTPEHPILTKRGWIESKDITYEDEIKIIANKCDMCGKIIPFWRTSCSDKCKGEKIWSNPKNRESIVKAGRERELKYHYMQTDKAKEARIKGFQKYLQKMGMNSQEYYLNIMFQGEFPNMFEFIGDGKECVEGYFPDWICKRYKLIIEFNGFGNSSKIRNVESFNRKREALEKAGYKMFIINDKDFWKPKDILDNLRKFIQINVYDPEFTFSKVKKINHHKITRMRYVYNLEVDEDNTYIAAGMIVHNCAQDLLGYQYYMNYGMKVIRTRTFNLIGPRSGEKIVSANIARQIASVEKKKTKPYITIGNPSTIRDFNDIRDVVNAYWLAINKCNCGEVYNICTGKGWSILQLLEHFMLHSSMQFTINQDKTKDRPTDVPILIGDSTKFRNLTGWKPVFTMKKTTLNVLDYWRNQV